MAWLRLERRGSVVTGSYANEGTGWTEFVSRTFDPPLAETLLVGAAAGSHSISGAYTTTDACEIEIVREPEGGATFRRGDGDGDGRVNLTDAVFTLNFLFLGGASPACHDAADADDDGMLNVTDAVIELNFLFLGGPDLAAPGTRDCGRDGDGSDRLRACVDRSCSRG
jgi:hypothetical protein